MAWDFFIFLSSSAAAGGRAAIAVAESAMDGISRLRYEFGPDGEGEAELARLPSKDYPST